MRDTLILALLLAGCTSAPDGDPVDTGSDDTSVDTDTDTQVTDGDKDEDGYTDSVDCDDTRATVHPDVASDICNGLDDDCDGEIDEDPDLGWYPDGDGDGFGDANGSAVVTCEGGDGLASNAADCNDADVSTFPGAPEICNGADDDCNGESDEDPATWQAFFEDADGDGAGTPDSFVYACTVPAGGSENDLDCDDTNADEPEWADPDASRSPDGSYDRPYASLQSAIEASTKCVIALPGEYVEDLDFQGRNITVSSLDGSDATKVRGTGRYPVVSFVSGETRNATLQGFTLTGGGGYPENYASTYTDGEGTTYYYYYYYQYGGGVYASHSSATLRDVRIEDNLLYEEDYGWTSSTEYVGYYSMGGGIYAYFGDLVLEDVAIVGNRASEGSAVYGPNNGTITATRLEVSENDGQYGVFTVGSGTVSLDAAIFNANLSDYTMGALTLQGGEVTIQNAVFASNPVAIYNYGAEVTLDSTSITGNDYGVYDESRGAAQWTLQFNNCASNTYRDWTNVTDPEGTDGNVSLSPGYTSYRDDGNSTNDDFSLSSSSRLIDAGTTDARRLDGDGTRNDIGAYGGPEGY